MAIAVVTSEAFVSVAMVLAVVKISPFWISTGAAPVVVDAVEGRA